MISGFKKFLVFLSAFFIITRVILFGAIAFYPQITSNSELDVNAKEIFNLTNEYRLKHGLGALTINPRLTQAAINKAEDILTKQYFSHTSPDGRKFSAWIKDVGYDYFYVGENLAIDFTSNQETFDAWIKSPGHRENIEKPQYQEIGIAALSGKFKDHSTVVVVQLFGTRVLGSQESDHAQTPIDFSANYFYPTGFWQKITSLSNLERLSMIDNYLIILFLGLSLILYTPMAKKNSQPSIKQPIISRYQAKTFKE